MIKDTFNSFTENINQKLKNPFLGTFIIVWIIRNWKFVYSLFYFDSDYRLENRIEKIKSYFLEYDIYEIIITIGISFLILIITYILLNLSRLIVNFFDKIITPAVYSLTDKSSVVLKSEFIKTLNNIERLELKVQNEREIRLKTQNENEQLENRIKELLVNKSTLTDKNSAIENIKSKKTKSNLIYNKLKGENQVKTFDILVGKILNKNTINPSEDLVSEFVKLGLIDRKEFMSGTGGGYKYELTADGKNIHDEIIKENLSNYG